MYSARMVSRCTPYGVYGEDILEMLYLDNAYMYCSVGDAWGGGRLCFVQAALLGCPMRAMFLLKQAF